MFKKLGLIIVGLFVSAVIAFSFTGAGREPVLVHPVLVAVFNAGFLSIILFFIAGWGARVFLLTGQWQVLWLSSGVFVLGIGSLFAGIQTIFDLNFSMAVSDFTALLAAIFFLHGTFRNFSEEMTRIPNPSQRVWRLCIYFAAVSASVLLFSLCYLMGILPPFFVPGDGSTFISNLFTVVIITLLLFSSAIYLMAHYQNGIEFFFWYALAILLLATGLFVQDMVPPGSILAWLGRIMQYTGGIYFLISTLSALKYARQKKIGVEKAVAGFFRDLRANYELLIKVSGDAIIAANGEGKIIQWNPAAEKMFGWGQGEAQGLSINQLFIEQNAQYLQKKIADLKLAWNGSSFIETRGEMLALRRSGESFPVSVALSARNTGEDWIIVMVIHDITDLKLAQEALIKANESLEIKVKERTAELEMVNAQLRDLTSKLAVAEEEERKRIATELHDNVGQMLALANLKLDALLQKSPSDLHKEMEDVLSILQKLNNETRSLMFQLSPPVLYDFGLEPAVEELAVLLEQQRNILITVDWNGQPVPLALEIKIILFQVIRELLWNIIKHSRASRAWVSFSHNRELEVVVRDNGVGFKVDQLSSGKTARSFGLLQVRERLRNIGGSFEIESAAGRGTTVKLRIPFVCQPDHLKQNSGAAG
jgi:PAS domain S-box-containing protein